MASLHINEQTHAMDFDEQMQRLAAPASRLHFLPHQRLSFRRRAQLHMLKFFGPADIPLAEANAALVETYADTIAGKFLTWHGIALWEASSASYSPVASVENDPILRRALVHYFVELLQMPLLKPAERKGPRKLDGESGKVNRPDEVAL